MWQYSSKDLEWIAVEISGVLVVNVYKPPKSPLIPKNLPRTSQSCIFAGDFNCHSTEWGYHETDKNGDLLADWASNMGLALLHDPKEPKSFRSGRWGTETDPDLAFTNIEYNRSVLDPFPKSQHRPSAILSPNPLAGNPAKKVKRWNFRKADWKTFQTLVDDKSAELEDPVEGYINSDYRSWTNSILNAAKTSIPRRCRTNRDPGWTDTCQNLYQVFINNPTIENADELMDDIMECKRERWHEAVSSIDFTHSSRKARLTLNKLTGRKPKPQRAEVSAKFIAMQLVNNNNYSNKFYPVLT